MCVMASCTGVTLVKTVFLREQVMQLNKMRLTCYSRLIQIEFLSSAHQSTVFGQCIFW